MLDNCPYCNSIRINKNDKKYNKQRYICRDCHKSFCEEDSRTKRPDFLKRVSSNSIGNRFIFSFYSKNYRIMF